MELAGNEKKIQALFRELKLADERAAPGFTRVWNRAQATSPGSPRVFKISFAVATALFVITLCSLVIWSRNWQRSQRSNPGVATGPTTPGSTLAPPLAPPLAPSLVKPLARQGPTQLRVAAPPNRVKANRWDRKLAARRQADLNARNVAIRETISISSWQSPTATLMQSPAADVLTSLPQLDQSLTELKTFLPNTPSYQNRERTGVP
jgi:hypothetical protein